MNGYERNLTKWEKEVYTLRNKTEYCIFCIRSGTINYPPKNFKMVGICKDCNETNIEKRIEIFFKNADSV